MINQDAQAHGPTGRGSDGAGAPRVSLLARVIAGLALPLIVATPALAADTFVAPNGSDTTGDGTIGKPFATWRPLCESAPTLPAGSHIYLRGGTYRNPQFGSGVDAPSLPPMACSGVAGGRLDVGPYGGEKVLFQYDSFTALRIEGAHVELHDVEVAGTAQSITYDEALADWWIGSRKFNGDGITIAGPDVTVRNTVVHDTPAAGIGGNAGADGAQVIDNLVYNAAWWSTKGTSGIKFTQVDDAGLTPTPPKITVRGNVVLNSESRLISHVFGKGAVRMEIDEGSSLLLQAASDANNPNGTTGTYSRGFDVRENLFANNGKGASLRSGGITLANNTLSGNGTTMDGGGAGLRVSDNPTPGLIATANIVAAAAGKNAVDIGPDSPTGIFACTANLWSGAMRNPAACADGLGGNLLVERPFIDAANGDYTPAVASHAGAGVPAAKLTEMRQRITAAGAPTRPTGWCVDKADQIARIIAQAPAGATIDSVSQAPSVVVTLPPGNPTGEPKISLDFNVVGPQPERVDLCGLAQGRVYSGTITGISITGWDHDATGADPIARAELLVNGAVVASDTRAPFTGLAIATPQGEGTLDVAARVFDAAGNALTSQVTRIAYRNVAPPNPATPTTPTGPARPTTRLSARLGLTRATMNAGARVVEIVAPISTRASGRARVAVQAAGRTTIVSLPVIRGAVRGRVAVSASQARAGRGLVTITYPGDPDARPARLQALTGTAVPALSVSRPSVVAGRLRATGRIAARARGTIVVTLELQQGGSIRTFRTTTRVAGGRWSVVGRALPATFIAAISQRIGTLDAYISYLGQGTPAIRGGQQSVQVLPAR